MFRICLLLLLTLVLPACGNLPAAWRVLPGSAPPAAGVRETPEAAARRIGSEGDYAGAAQAFQTLATQTGSTQSRQDYQMSAIEYWLKANRTEEAKRLLPGMQGENPALQWRLQLAYARLELADNQPAAVLARLDALGSTIPAQVQANYLEIRALALEAQGQSLEAARARAALDSSLRAGLESKTNQQSLWQDLMRLTPAQLGQPPADADKVLQGWMNLAWLVKTAGALTPQVAQGWQQRYPQHPATQTLLPTLVSAQAANPAPLARQIALLLPLSGDLKRAGETVRDGFLAAWRAEGGEAQGMSVKVYDADQNNVVQVYQQALAEGAFRVAGPLNKDAVNALAAAYPSFPVPTLSLNYHIELSQSNTYTPPANFYQLSLSAEDEARVVATQAWNDGMRRAVALVPEGDWGKRVLGAFARQWESQGGQLAGYTAYRKNYSEAVRQLLQGQSPADMVFVGAFPDDARQIRPLLKYYAAGKLPVYATSQIFGGLAEPGQDKDLDGVLFVDMPRLITPPVLDSALYAPVAQTWQNWPAANKRFYALGIDAYRLLTRPPQPGAPPQAGIAGETGQLWLDQQNVVHRELPRAIFENGAPRAYDGPVATAPPTPAP